MSLTPPDPAADRLSALLARFRVSAELHHSGQLCGLNHFDASKGHGYLHVLRRGRLEVRHPGDGGAPYLPGSRSTSPACCSIRGR